MKTLNVVVSLVLYGNTFPVVKSVGLFFTGASTFGSFRVVEGLVCIIAGVVVGTMGLNETSRP